ncbi:MAG: hypothetical protein FD127_4422, partial [Acidimicrobiaceae bacterium]
AEVDGRDATDASLSAVDVVTGDYVPHGRDHRVPPPNMLELSLDNAMSRQPAALEFSRAFGRSGEYGLRLLIGDTVMLEHRFGVTSEAAPAGSLTIDVPAGRAVSIDCARAVASHRAGGARPTFASFGAWPSPTAHTLMRSGFSRRIAASVVRLPEVANADSTVAMLWVEPDVESIAFGFVEETGCGWTAAPGLDVMQMALPPDSQTPIEMPVPTRWSERPSDVVVTVVYRDAPLDLAGIPVCIRRLADRGGEAAEAPGGFARVATDSDGGARIQMSPGRYVAYVDPAIGWSTPVQFSVAVGAAAASVRMPLEFCRP